MTQTRSAQRRAKRRTQHAKQTRDTTSAPSGPEHEHTLTLHQAHHLAEAMTAEQCGDIDSALAHVQRVPELSAHSWSEELTEMAGLASDAQPWRWARFTVTAAGRWVRTLQTPLVARVLREVSGNAAGAAGDVASEYRGWVAGSAALLPAIDGMLLFDEFMAEVFLVQCAPELAARSGGGRHWAGTPGRVYELVGVDGPELIVRDRADGLSATVRNLGEMEGLGSGVLVYGHLVDVPGEPAFMFAAPPIVVDEMAAQRLERSALAESGDLDAWCAAVGAAVRSGAPFHAPSSRPVPERPMADDVFGADVPWWADQPPGPSEVGDDRQ